MEFDASALHRNALPRCAFVVRSLKHPDEVARLRKIYPHGFYLLGVHCAEDRRRTYLREDRELTKKQAAKLMKRDAKGRFDYGQQTSETFHLSDFFVHLDGSHDRLEKSVWRVLEILFGDPHKTPTFDEFAMFMAFAASLRSADLSRQVGAVIARNNEIMATGANDCPRAGGGLYWPELDKRTYIIDDAPNGRDYKRCGDMNQFERRRLIREIVALMAKVAPDIDQKTARAVLEKSSLRDITEYGRVVHAEMEALLSCARSNISCRDGELFSTTFPCHNCAKHIVAAGIRRVVYVEPYPKSKVFKFYKDSISCGLGADSKGRVLFEPFVGVGPRRFLDLFSMRLGAGSALKRKTDTGHPQPWAPRDANLRIQMSPYTYLTREKEASQHYKRHVAAVADSPSS